TICISGAFSIAFRAPGSRELVRAKGLEPPHLAILGPKPSASTDSATPAARRISGGPKPDKQGCALRIAGRKGQAARRGEYISRNAGRSPWVDRAYTKQEFVPGRRPWDRPEELI